MHLLFRIKDAVFQLYASDSEAQYEMAEIVFTTFDHSITDAEAMKLKRIGLAQLVKVRICRPFPHFSPFHDCCMFTIVLLSFTSNSNIDSFLVFILMLLMFLGSAGQQVVRRGI